MPRTLVNRNLLIAHNPGFEVFPTHVAALNTGTRWINGLAAGSSALSSAYKWGSVAATTLGTWTAEFDNTQAYSGSRSLKITLGATGASVDIGTSTSVSDVPTLIRTALRVSGSTQYTGRFRMKTNYVSGDGSSGAAVTFTERNAAGGGGVNNTTTRIKTTTDWTLYEITFTTASATRFIIARASVVGTGGAATLLMSANFDDFDLFPTTAPTRLAVA